MLLAVAAISGAMLLDAGGYHLGSILVIVGTGAASLAFFHRSWRIDAALRRALDQVRGRYAEVYERAGISIWQEDWSAVGEAMARLRDAGVADIPAWYAARPEEARALHAQVRITDVNRHSVALMRARSDRALIGSLADVLPGSAATFGHWLTALDRGDEVYVNESVIHRCDGEPFDCLVTAALPRQGEPFGKIIVSIVEITAYKRDQARLAEARDDIARTQRIATVGALTASIAHEVNSPLAAIASNAAACRRWLERPQPEIAEALAAAAAVIVEAERARAVIDRTRAYLQRAERIEEERDLRSLIRDALRIVEGEAHAHEISIGLDLADTLGRITCDPVQLQQALVNLMVNAIQAMSRNTGNRHLAVTAARDGGEIRITIEDSGIGIAPENLRRIFEPFYSTKEGGMGMGLSICRTALEAHGGSLAVESTPGVGTRFIVRLREGRA